MFVKPACVSPFASPCGPDICRPMRSFHRGRGRNPQGIPNRTARKGSWRKPRNHNVPSVKLAKHVIPIDELLGKWREKTPIAMVRADVSGFNRNEMVKMINIRSDAIRAKVIARQKGADIPNSAKIFLPIFGLRWLRLRGLCLNPDELQQIVNTYRYKEDE